jgi:putative membrane protein
MYSKYWLVGLTGVLMACGGKSTPEAQSPEPPPAEATPPAYTAVPEAPMASTEQQPAAVNPSPAVTTQTLAAEPAPEPLSDGQIAAITDAANTGEVAQAQIAQKKAKSPRVQKFATMMIAHHSQAKKQQADLLKRLGITEVENKKSTALVEESNKTLESLKALNRTEFDRAYIDMQVDAHQKVLDALDTDLIPNAKNAEFKASLVEFRPRVESHLREAQDIQQALAATPMNPIGSAGAGTKSGPVAESAKPSTVR